MRIALSAYGCEPDKGSEQAVGWNIACELAAIGHEVVVVTCGGHHRGPIEAWSAAHGLAEMVAFKQFDYLKVTMGGEEAFLRGVFEHMGIFGHARTD